MKFFKRLFGKDRLELLPMVHMCSVLYCSKGIFISAVHRDISGMCPHGWPMVLLPLDAAPLQIGEAVLASLKGLRDGLSLEESENQSSEALKVAGERSLAAFDKRWNHIRVAYDDGNTSTVVMYPMHRYSTGGHVMLVDDKIYRSRADAMEVGRVIREIVDSPPLPVVQHVPGHT